MKTPARILMLLLAPLYMAGQGGMWTWLKGSNQVDPGPVFGTQGFEAAGNHPPGLYEAAHWTDLQGNFWIFGGLTTQSYEESSDLWKYNPATNNWTWVKGPGVNQSGGQYGTLLAPNIANMPPSRAWGVACWTDHNGDLWMYGGSGHGGNSYSDIWKYNISSNTWTWMHGHNTTGNAPVYGTNGIPGYANSPGGRWELGATWVDANNDLWLFGGAAGGSVSYNDVWRYSTSTNEWTWMKGGPGQTANYGIKGVPNSSNTPGPRSAHCAWLDANGNAWLFGGMLYVSSTTVMHYNDMWRYEPLTNNWTWMSGTNLTDNAGSYSAFCSPGINNLPSSRNEHSAHWVDKCGNFCFYGGMRGNLGEVNLSDLWRFNPSTLEWTLENGNSSINVTGVYGTQLVPAAGNTPGGRGGAVTFVNQNGDVFLFGGTVNGWLLPYNDLWKFTADSACQAMVGGTLDLGPDTTYCGSFVTTLSTGSANTHWSTGEQGAAITISTPGTYWAVANTQCGAGSDTVVIQQNNDVLVNLGPDTTLCTGSITLNAANPGATYHWQDNSTGPALTVVSAGIYAVTVTGADGCVGNAQVNVSMAVNLGLSVNHTTCGSSNGSAVVTTSTGTPPFTFLWNTGNTTSSLANVAGGTYSITVTDSAGCSVSSSVIINPSGNTPIGITAANNIMCAGDSIQLCAPVGYSQYNWNGGQNTRCIYAKLAGNYYLQVTDNANCTATSNHVSISVYPSPPVSFTVNGDTLTAYNADGYQWYFNQLPIAGATSPVLIANQSGSYTVAITDSNGCVSFSNAIIYNSILQLNQSKDLYIYPNPNNTQLWHVQADEKWLGAQIEILDATGRLLMRGEIVSKHQEITLDAPAGIYVLHAYTPQQNISVKLLKW